jgi:hypothetical protein
MVRCRLQFLSSFQMTLVADKSFSTEKLPGDFAVWLASPEAEFLNGRFVWAQWDVDELISLKDRIAADPTYLTTALVK